MSHIDRDRRQFFSILGAAGAVGLLAASRVPLPTVNAISPETAANSLPPKTIEGVETYGDGAPLTYDQFNAVIADLNQKPDTREPNVYYGGYIISQSWYQSFSQKNGGKSFQTFLKDVYAGMTAMAPQGIEIRAQTIFVTQDTAFQNNPPPPGSWNTSYLDGGPKTLDGWEGVVWDTPPSYTEINARRHEDFHRVTRLNDRYGLDSLFNRAAMIAYYSERASESQSMKNRIAARLGVHPDMLEQHLEALSRSPEPQTTSDTASAFENVPLDWQEYITNLRKNPPDPNGDEIMARTDAPNLGSFNQEILTDRYQRGITHDFGETVRDYDGFQVEGFVANTNVLNLGTQYNGYDVTIFSTHGSTSLQRTLTQINSGTVQGGKFNMGNPFAGKTETIDGTQMVTGETGVLFIKVVDPNNPKHPFYTWMDVTDLSCGYLKTGRPPQGIEISPKLNRTGAFANHDFSGNTDAKALPPVPTPRQDPTPTAVVEHFGKHQIWDPMAANGQIR